MAFVALCMALIQGAMAQMHVSNPDAKHSELSGSSHFDTPLVAFVIAALAAVSVVMYMYAGRHGGGNARLPPSWGPELEGSYPFHIWSRDILLWSISVDMDPARKAAVVLSQLSQPNSADPYHPK